MKSYIVKISKIVIFGAVIIGYVGRLLYANKTPIDGDIEIINHYFY